MGRGTYLILCSMIMLCRGAKLLPLGLHTDGTKEGSISPTISVQRFDGKAFYNLVQPGEQEASVSGRNQAEVESSEKAEKNSAELCDHDEDDAEGSSTTLLPTTTVDVVVVSAAEDATQVPSGNLEDSPAVTAGSPPETPPSAPSDSNGGGSLPESPAEGGSSDPTPNPGDAVPGQSGEDSEEANAPSSSSSSSSEEDHSSSSSSEEFRNAQWEKAWQHKLKNELIMRAGGSKDAKRIESPMMSKYLKKVKFSRRIY